MADVMNDSKDIHTDRWLPPFQSYNSSPLFVSYIITEWDLLILFL